jgi:cellulose synthase/poly-beta-1,6-N-acetylglucosamine synthase-like glycosyltransferase
VTATTREPLHASQAASESPAQGFHSGAAGRDDAREAMAWLNAPLYTQRLHRRGRESRAGRPLRGTLALLALLPMIALLSIRLARLLDNAFLTLYGVGVLSATLLIMYLAFGWYYDKSRGRLLPEDPPLVTCMLAVHNDVDVVGRCVNSVLNCNYPNLELIVVDDASTDGTAELLAKLSRQGRFIFIPLTRNAGKKRALTLAAEQARGDIFVFTDSDCIISPSAIAQCVKALLSDPTIGGVSGHARALNANRTLLTKIQDTWYDGQFGIAKAAESVFGSVTCVSGPMAAFRREAVYNYLPAWAEDRFLGREFKFATDRQLTAYVLGQQRVGARLKAQFSDSPFVRDVDYPEQRWRVEYVASARVLTNVPESLRSMLRQQVRWKKSFIRNLFFTGGFLWRRGALPSFLFYGHVLWVCAAPVLAFRHLVWLPLHGSFFLTFVYLCGVALKGSIWALAHKVQNPKSSRWMYRPLMSLLSAVCLSWILPYSALTLRKSVWSRG